MITFEESLIPFKKDKVDSKDRDKGRDKEKNKENDNKTKDKDVKDDKENYENSPQKYEVQVQTISVKVKEHKDDVRDKNKNDKITKLHSKESKEDIKKESGERRVSQDSVVDIQHLEQVKKDIENEVVFMVHEENRFFSNLSSGFLILISILLIIRVQYYFYLILSRCVLNQCLLPHLFISHLSLRIKHMYSLLFSL